MKLALATYQRTCGRLRIVCVDNPNEGILCTSAYNPSADHVEKIAPCLREDCVDSCQLASLRSRIFKSTPGY